MKQAIAILSPHLDDAVFNCCDHILGWRRGGIEVSVYTVFCSFKTPCVSTFQQEVMRKAGVASVEEFEAMRRAEDVHAMQLLDVKWRQLDYVDAGFRAPKGAPTYENLQQLCSGKRHPDDASIFEQIIDFIKNDIAADLVLVPFGVGQHVDHLIVRQAAEAVGDQRELRYYLDYPYARNPRRWRLLQFKEAIRAKKSIRWMNSNKRKIMNCYASQVSQIFRWPPIYPEIILS